MAGKKKSEATQEPQEEKTVIEIYNEIKQKIKAGLANKKMSEIRTSTLKWIGYKLAEVEFAIKSKDRNMLTDIIIEVLATLEAIIEIQEERASYYRNKSNNSNWKRGYNYSKRR